MKSLIGIALIALGVTVQANAHPSQYHLAFSNIHAHVKFAQGPYIGAESILKLEFKNPSDHSPMEPTDKVFVELYMPAHKHGSSPTTISAPRGDGTFDVTKVYFSMGGKWDVNVYLLGPDGAVKEMEALTVELGPQDRK